jgi:hypothetical protein
VAKMAFAEEVFKLVEGIPQSCQVIPKKAEKTPKRERLYH